MENIGRNKQFRGVAKAAINVNEAIPYTERSHSTNWISKKNDQPCALPIQSVRALPLQSHLALKP